MEKELFLILGQSIPTAQFRVFHLMLKQLYWNPFSTQPEHMITTLQTDDFWICIKVAEYDPQRKYVDKDCGAFFVTLFSPLTDVEVTTSTPEEAEKTEGWYVHLKRGNTPKYQIDADAYECGRGVRNATLLEHLRAALVHIGNAHKCIQLAEQHLLS